jgi:replicative DNA helicase
LINSFERSHTERAVLACALQNPDLIIGFDGKLDINAFHSPLNQALIRTCLKLYEQGYKRFERELIFNQVITQPIEGFAPDQVNMYITSLLGADVHSINFELYVTDLLDAYSKYKLQKTLTDSLDKLTRYGDQSAATDIISSIQSEIMSLHMGISSDEPEDVCAGIQEHIDAMFEHPEDNLGIPTGISLLDELILGWLKTKLYVIAARPGRGKSAFLMQSAIWASFYAHINRCPVLYIDTEIGTKEFKNRTLAHLSSVDALKIMRAGWRDDPAAVENMNAAVKIMQSNTGNRYMHRYVPGFKTSQVENMIKKSVYNHGTGLVIFDYLKEPRDIEDKARWQKVGELCRMLKELAGQLEIPVITALQQNKKGEGVSRVDASAMGESDDPYKESDVTCMLNWKTAKEVQAETLNAGTHRFQIVKGRYTQAQLNGLNFRYFGYCFRFIASPIQQLMEVGGFNANNATTPAPIGQLPTVTEHQAAPFANYGQGTS